MNRSKTIDPLTVSIIEHRLVTITEEIGKRTMKSCYSFPTAHIRDLGISLFDRDERLIAHGDWMPTHVAGAHVSLGGILDYIGRDDIRPDDFMIGNDYFIVRCGHLPDWSFVRPVFYKGKLEFFTYMRTHMYDSGGAYPVSYFPRAYDCHAEGLIIPPTKILAEGKVNATAKDLIMHNVRGAPMVWFDLMLIHSSMKMAEERLIGICEEYGVDVVRQTIDEAIRGTEKMVRETISKWPAGTYKAERCCDRDGTTDDPVHVRVALTIDPQKGELTFDYSDSDKQVNFVNSPLGNTYGATIAPILWCIPSEIPHTQGLNNCIKIIVKEGTVLSPTYPATCAAQGCSLWTEIMETALCALAQAIPKDTPAMWTRHWGPTFHGKDPRTIDPRTGNPQLYSLPCFHSDGSAGAIWGYDGWNGIGPGLGAGAIMRSPIEIEEAIAPWRWLCYEGVTDSAGDGQFRGGIGTHVEYLCEHDPESHKYGDSFVQTGMCDGEKFGPLGFLGGTAGKTNKMWIKREGKLMPLHSKEIANILPGDQVITKCGGGGGIGNPVDREIDKVRWDVLNEYISVETARKVYKVVVAPNTFEIDKEATAKLRKKGKK
jgi:N-methylhydantoinase B